MRGGHCVQGACDTTYYVEQDGRVHLAAKPPNEVATLDEAGLAEIRAQIDAADFDEIRSHPFTGTCPTAFDGQELVLEFGTDAGPEQIATCEVAIDWTAPLFAPIAFAFEPLLGDLTRF